MLDGKTAVIYGGGGAIGGAVARAFAAAGAHVHLVGRTLASLERVAADCGGKAEVATVNALDEHAVEAHADTLDRIDIAMNVIGHPYTHGTPGAEMALADFVAPVEVAVRTTFITWRACARWMRAQGSGVLLAFGGSGSPTANIGGTQIAFASVEAMRRQFALELAPHGIRVVTLKTAGIPESIADAEERAAVEPDIVAGAALGYAATLADVGNVAVFVASDAARTITGTEINMTCGAEID